MHLLKAAPSLSITIHTDNQFATVSLLSSLSCTLNLQNSAQEENISDLDFCDLVSESMAAQKIKKGLKKWMLNVFLTRYQYLQIEGDLDQQH